MAENPTFEEMVRDTLTQRPQSDRRVAEAGVHGALLKELITLLQSDGKLMTPPSMSELRVGEDIPGLTLQTPQQVEAFCYAVLNPSMWATLFRGGHLAKLAEQMATEKGVADAVIVFFSPGGEGHTKDPKQAMLVRESIMVSYLAKLRLRTALQGEVRGRLSNASRETATEVRRTIDS